MPARYDNLLKQIMDLHDGEISVESSEGQGTAFTVALPVSKKSK